MDKSTQVCCRKRIREGRRTGIKGEINEIVTIVCSPESGEERYWVGGKSRQLTKDERGRRRRGIFPSCLRPGRRSN